MTGSAHKATKFSWTRERFAQLRIVTLESLPSSVGVMIKSTIVFAFWMMLSSGVCYAEMLSHPGGCPRRAFCGCGASVDLFGRPVRELFLSSSWLRFPRSEPGYNKVAVRRGHVFVLKQHISGTTWLVYDANSGGRGTRMHPRSIAGYTIVNPSGG